MGLKKRSLSICLVVVIILSLTITSANAQNYSNKDTNCRTNVPHAGVYQSPVDGKWYLYSFRVNLKPLASCIFSNTEKSLLECPTFKDWTFQNSSGQLPGTFNIMRYDAGKCKYPRLTPPATNNWDDNIKHYFEVDYNNGGTPPTLPTGYKLAWIQIIYNNYPEYPSPHIDPISNNFEDGLPFYFNKTQMDKKAFGDLKIYNRADNVNMTFYDCPSYPFSNAIKHNLNPVSFEAHLYAAAWNQTAPGTVIVYYKGVKWGYEITWERGMELRPWGTLPYKNGGVAGNEKPCEVPEGDPLNGTETEYYPVGGVWVPVDKFGLLVPYIALASTILVATAATAIYVKRRNKKQ